MEDECCKQAQQEKLTPGWGVQFEDRRFLGTDDNVESQSTQL